jgi:hypothetical protein
MIRSYINFTIIILPGMSEYDIGNFTLKDMTECSAVLRSIGSGAANMEEVADKIVRHLYEHIVVKETGVKESM